MKIFIGSHPTLATFSVVFLCANGLARALKGGALTDDEAANVDSLVNTVLAKDPSNGQERLFLEKLGKGYEGYRPKETILNRDDFNQQNPDTLVPNDESVGAFLDRIKCACRPK